jgi:hypothetical protein
MRESQGQNRRGTPTGERALQGARLPQGKQVRPRLSAFCFPLIAGSESERFAAGLAPSPIVVIRTFHPGSSDEDRERGVVFGNGVPHASGANKKTHRENGSACLLLGRLP